MKSIFLFILCFVCFGCDGKGPVQNIGPLSSEYGFNCVLVHEASFLNTSSLYRCENEEAICYTKLSIDSGISCYFKKGF